MATVNDITDGAYKKVGILSPSSDQDDDALDALNNMLAAWGVEFLNYYLVDETLTVVTTATYTIGSGGDLDTTRPISLENAYLRNSNDVDFPLRVVSYIERSHIAQKDTETRPRRVCFLPEYPLAKLVFDSEPTDTYTAYLTFRKGFAEYTAITDTVTLPGEFREAIIYNLAVKLAEDNSVDCPRTVYSTAQTSKLLIQRAYDITAPAPQARFEIGTRAKGTYNIMVG